MSAPHKNPDLQKVTLNLRAGDWDYLSTLCAPRGIATAVAIRNIISARVDELRAREEPIKLNIGESNE